MSEEGTGAGTGVLQTDTRGVTAAGLGMEAPGQVTTASRNLQTMPVVMHQWYFKQSITK